MIVRQGRLSEPGLRSEPFVETYRFDEALRLQSPFWEGRSRARSTLAARCRDVAKLDPGTARPATATSRHIKQTGADGSGFCSGLTAEVRGLSSALPRSSWDTRLGRAMEKPDDDYLVRRDVSEYRKIDAALP